MKNYRFINFLIILVTIIWSCLICLFSYIILQPNLTSSNNGSSTSIAKNTSKTPYAIETKNTSKTPYTIEKDKSETYTYRAEIVKDSSGNILSSDSIFKKSTDELIILAPPGTLNIDGTYQIMAVPVTIEKDNKPVINESDIDREITKFDTLLTQKNSNIPLNDSGLPISDKNGKMNITNTIFHSKFINSVQTLDINNDIHYYGVLVKIIAERS